MVPFFMRRYPRNTGTTVQRARLLTSALDMNQVEEATVEV